MKSITIHQLDDTVESLIRKKAKQQGMSLNKTIQLLLKQALGIRPADPGNHKDDFMDLFGIWSAADEKDFRLNTRDFARIDESDWK